MYEWDFDDGSPISTEFQPNHFYREEGQYVITLIAGFNHGAKDVDGDGVTDGDLVCADTAQVEVLAREGGLTRVPNAFTPNENGPNGGVQEAGGFNDVFLPITRGVEEFTMQIFDRWGTLIFESRDKNVGWDGYDRNGNLLPAGVYVFKLVLRLSNGQRTTQVGDVTLIR
jgi:gliding motility-associated-like protein